MRKHVPKTASFVPLSGFDAELQSALAPAVLREAAALFIPLDDGTLRKWVGNFVQKSRDDLRALYDRYQLSPVKILAAVVMVKTWSLTKEELLRDGWLDPKAPPEVRRSIEEGAGDFSFPKLRSYKQREKDARLLEAAAKCLEEWNPVLRSLEQRELFIDLAGPLRKAPASFDDSVNLAIKAGGLVSNAYPGPIMLREFANRLRALGPSKRHRPKNPQLEIYAKYLASFLAHETGFPCYGYLGEFLRTAFPKEWNPAGDIREAAKKLVKSKAFPVPIYLGNYSPTVARTSGKESKKQRATRPFIR